MVNFHIYTVKACLHQAKTNKESYPMKGSPCCAGLMRSCLHTYRTKTNLTQHIIQPWGGVINQLWGEGSSTNYGGPSTDYGGASAKYGGVINHLWGGHQPTMGGHQLTMGGSSTDYGGASTDYWGGHQATMGGSSTNYGGGVFSHQYVQEVKIHRIT